MGYQIGEPVGIAWEPHNREFEICDIREIHYKLTDMRTIEYQLARIGIPEIHTDWLTEDRIFKL